MRFGSARYVVPAALLLIGAFALRGELQEWVQHLPAGPLIAVFFRTVNMPGGPIAIRRPPAETRAALSDAILVQPDVSNLYRLRAHEDELALDFPAAESDWLKYAHLQRNRVDGYLSLADYYHRREQSSKELGALQIVAALATDPIRPLEEQPPWHATERILSVVDEEGLSPALSDAAFDAWIHLHPADAQAYQKAIEFYVAKKQFDRAQAEIDSYAKQFPGDLIYPVRERAALAVAQGSIDNALAIYDTSFTPLWPRQLTDSWFELLQSQHRTSEFVGHARTILQSNPADLNAAARLFDYFLNSSNATEARRVLLQYRAGRTWTADELWTIGQLFERLPDPNEAARSYYALYSLPEATPAGSERAIAALANLLLTQPEQRLAFGSGDLSFYRDIARLDSSPGFLNGILSLVFNSASPAREYDSENLKSVAYFHRAAGERLVDLLAQRFPNAERLPELRAILVQAYATYSEEDAVVRSGQAYLTAFPKGAERVQVAMLLGDAFASLHRETEELALYDRLLEELSDQAQNVPLGDRVARDEGEPIPDGAQPRSAAPRSPEYQQVLDRYLARLSQMNRPMDALRLYRREIDRNPNDPGLYREFAAYLDHNRLGTQMIETYRRAMERFPDRSWYHSLARWYLREKRTDDFRRLTREVTGIFSGSDLESYFNRVVATADLDADLYLQLNLYAHQKFPDDLPFVNNLLNAYSRPETGDGEAYNTLIRTYWYYDGNFKRQYFSRLSASGRLAAEIDGVRKASPAMAQGNWKQAAADNPAAVQFLAEGESWLSHFEAAAPAFRAVAEATPGDRVLTSRGASIYRSLAAYFPGDTQVAVSLTDLTVRSQPRDRELLASVGDIYADRDRLPAASPIWNSILKIEPGKTDSWLSAATVFWDYYMYDDALRIIADGRRKFNDPTLFAYQAGAIYEGQRDYTRAIQQYANGAVHGDSDAKSRLLRLAQRKATADIVDRVTASLKPDAAVRDLRIAVLETQNRRDGLEALLNSTLNSSTSLTEAVEIAAVAQRDGFPDLDERATLKEVALTVDPIEKMRKQIDLARFYAARGDGAKAQQTFDALYKTNPKVLGVVRAAVDFEKQQNHLDRAIQILLGAAAASNADLASQFTLEAARTATDAGQYDRSRALLAGLLKTDPYRADYLAAEADTYARAKDDAGFEKFTLATIKTLQNAPLPAQDRTERIAALRRGLIPVLTREGAFDRATDQYIETINRYPEDDALAREAAQYAIVHSRLEQLLTFYRKTIQDAPRDYRWPIVLARVETVAVDYRAAIDAYQLAMTDRPDRADLPEARAALEERLLRFDDAAKTYGKLYELTYHDPQWLEHIASLQARLGHVDEAVKDLRTAIVGDHKESAEALFEIADRLDGWNLPQKALPFAARGQALSEEPQEIYYRILARTRGWNDLFATWTEETNQAAQVVATEYTPEEKAQVERTLQDEIDWLPFVQKAELAPLEARLLLQFADSDETLLGQLYSLQTRRGLFGELGAEMERLAAMSKNGVAQSTEENDAASAYVAEGDRANALRVISDLATREPLPSNLQEWLLATLSKDDPEALIGLARSNTYDSLRNGAVQVAIGHNDSAVALRAVDARGRSENALWTRAFTALTGVYFADPEPAVNAAFVTALNSDATIGARLKSPVNREEQLAGSLWFYYGARYGEYLVDSNRADTNRNAAEFLPSSLEATPGNPEAYMQLGGFYESKDRADSAIERYREALQLDGNRGDAHDHIARILAKHGKPTQALEEWRAAITVYEHMQSRGVAVPESFWAQATETISDIGANGALHELQPDLARWIGDYAQRNGEYRLEPLLNAAFNASLDARENTAWVLDIAVDYAGDQAFTGFLANKRLTNQQRVELQRRRLEVTRTQLASAHGDAQLTLERQLGERRVELVMMLIDTGDAAAANAEWSKIPDDIRRVHYYEGIVLADASGTLNQLLALYRARPERAPSFNFLLQTISQLRDRKLNNAALLVAEFAYRRELDNQNLDASNFLGLAEVMLERKHNAEAIALLHRMNLVSGQPFETLLPAADLLLRYKLNAEAVPFLRDRVRAVPWDATARVELAKLLTRAEHDALMNQVIADRNAPYRQRIAAAEALAPRGTLAAPADSELAVLARGPVLVADAEKPYRVAARVKAAKGANALKLLREASSIAPEDSAIRILEIRAALADARDTLALSLASMSDPNGIVVDAALAVELSKAAERVDDLAAAISFATKADAKDRVALLQREQERRASNAARQPVIGKSIEQAAIVKPRIKAGSAQ